MGKTDSDATTSGGVSKSRSRAWTHLNVDRCSPSYWRVTFDHPPINTITATTIAELADLVGLIEQDPNLNVIVFDSANPHFYLAHYDVENDPGKTAALGVGPTGMPAWLDVLARLSRASVVSIASIRGRARGAGSEFILACDMRFASRENTLLGQFEVAVGVVPGGNPMARLSRLAGRGRALEVLLVADDVDGARAEQYGYVNRAIADGELDAEVDMMAIRIASFDHDAIARTKSYVDQVTLPADSELPPATADFRELFLGLHSRHNGPGFRNSGSTPTATSNDRLAAASSSRYPTPELNPHTRCASETGGAQNRDAARDRVRPPIRQVRASHLEGRDRPRRPAPRARSDRPARKR